MCKVEVISGINKYQQYRLADRFEKRSENCRRNYTLTDLLFGNIYALRRCTEDTFVKYILREHTDTLRMRLLVGLALNYVIVKILRFLDCGRSLSWNTHVCRCGCNRYKHVVQQNHQ